MIKLRNIIKGTSGKTRVGILLTILTLCVGMFAVSAFASHNPSRTSTAGSYEQLRGASPAFQNFIIDEPVVWVPFAPMAFTVSVTSDVTGTFAATVNNAATGNALLAENDTSGVSGWFVDTSNDAIVFLVPIPSDADLTEDISFRTIWANSESAATGSMTAVWTYEIIDNGVSTLGAGEPDDAMDTAGGADVDLAADVVQFSPYSIIAGSTISGTTPDDMLLIKLKVTLTTIADASFFGAQIKFKRKWLGGGA